MKELISEVEKTTQNELERASEKYGRTYASLHEAYGVLVEEISEANALIEGMNSCIKNLKLNMRFNAKNDKNTYKEIAKTAMLCACELIQVAGVATKAQRGYGNEN